MGCRHGSASERLHRLLHSRACFLWSCVLIRVSPHLRFDKLGRGAADKMFSIATMYDASVVYRLVFIAFYGSGVEYCGTLRRLRSYVTPEDARVKKKKKGVNSVE